MSRSFMVQRLSLAAALLAAAAICLPVSATAGPVGGARYEGHIHNYFYRTAIVLEVNKKETKVTRVTTDGMPVQNYPACMQQPAGGSTGTSDISNDDRFKAKVKYAAGTTFILGTAVIKGKFGGHGRVHGTVKFSSDFNPDCNGVADFSARVKK